jgi:hypothetical protein
MERDIRDFNQVERSLMERVPSALEGRLSINGGLNLDQILVLYRKCGGVGSTTRENMLRFLISINRL